MTNVQSNIRQFSLFTAKVFNELYDAHPTPIVIDCFRIAHNKEFDLAEWSDVERSGTSTVAEKFNALQRATNDERTRRCIDTVKWLAREEYIRGTSNHMNDFRYSGATLGIQGFVAMRRLPGELDPEVGGEDTFADALRKNLGKPAGAARDTLMGKLIEELFWQMGGGPPALPG